MQQSRSKLQNEYDIYYRVLISNGRFIDYEDSQSKNEIYDSGHHVNRNAKKVLFYNEPLSHISRIELNKNELRRNKYIFEIYFYFGGKQSPLMVSQYTFQIDPTNVENKNINILKTENQYSYEISDKLDLSHEERMKFILED